MLNVDKLIASAEECLGWPYVSPGSNDSRGIDCSGLFVKCFRDQGASIYHGSNTIWRKYLSEKGELKRENQLLPGMAVFKWNPNTPAKFNDGQGDFQHIGLVVSVNPLRIIHASTGTMCVTTDTKLGKWKFWGKLKDVDYGTGGSTPGKQTEPQKENPEPSAPEKKPIGLATVWSENGLPVKMRKKASLSCNQWIRLNVGTEVELLEYDTCTDKNGTRWSKVSSGWRVGWYIMSEFLSFG